MLLLLLLLQRLWLWLGAAALLAQPLRHGLCAFAVWLLAHDCRQRFYLSSFRLQPLFLFLLLLKRRGCHRYCALLPGADAGPAVVTEQKRVGLPPLLLQRWVEGLAQLHVVRSQGGEWSYPAPREGRGAGPCGLCGGSLQAAAAAATAAKHWSPHLDLSALRRTAVDSEAVSKGRERTALQLSLGRRSCSTSIAHRPPQPVVAVSSR